MVVKKTNTWKIILVTYVVLSALFIIISIFVYLRNGVYQAWIFNAYNTVVQKANSSCDVFSISNWTNQVNLINVACLQQQAPVDGEAISE